METEQKEETKFCADCRIECEVTEMKKRKFVTGIFERKEVVRWVCPRCASRY